jgi:hypothetical protein
MSYEAPPWAPARQRKEYTDLLLDSFVSPNPVFSLQLHLPATQGVAPRSLKPVFTANWDLERDDGGSHSLSTSNKNCSSAANCAPPALADAAYTWMSSALDYRDMPNGDEGARAVRALVAANPQRWGATELGDKEKDKTPRTPSTTGGFSIPPTPTIAPQSPTTPMTAKDLPIPGRTSLAAWVIHKLP